MEPERLDGCDCPIIDGTPDHSDECLSKFWTEDVHGTPTSVNERQKGTEVLTLSNPYVQILREVTGESEEIP